jgi:hypothetical protein
MAISISRDNNLTTSHKMRWKGFHDGQAWNYDQIAGSIGKAGTPDSHKNTLALFGQPFTPRFYAGAVVRYSDSAAVFPDRLPRDCATSGGFHGLESRNWIVENSALHHRSKIAAASAKKRAWDNLLASIFSTAKADGLIEQHPEASIDSTGLESHFVSRHFLLRQGKHTQQYRRWTKLTIVCHNASHLIAGSIVSTGPSNDCPYLAPAVSQAVMNLPIERLLADAGYDAEANHKFCRQKLDIRSTIIPVNERGRKKGELAGHYRNQMKNNFPKRKFGQRWQVESVMSRMKRRLGYALRGRTNESRNTECGLRVLTYNLMLLYLFFYKGLLIKGFYRAL